MNDLEDRVGAQMSVRIDGSAFAIDYSQWKVGWVDTTAK